MHNATRHLCLAVLLALLIGHASFAVHAASHVVEDTAECELCISYGDSSEALAGESEHGVPEVAAALTRSGTAAVAPARDVVPFQQRGPPYSD